LVPKEILPKEVEHKGDADKPREVVVKGQQGLTLEMAKR
jgi:hypothetical protein